MFAARPQTDEVATSPRRIRRAWLGVLGVLLVVALCLTAVSAGLAYSSSERCARCHEPWVVASRIGSSHAAVECVQCHVSLGRGFGLVGVVHFAEAAQRSDAASSSSAGLVSSGSCGECHVPDDIAQVTVSRGVRMSHIGLAEGGYECVDCHEGVVHGQPKGKLAVPTMSMCVRCHDGSTAPDDCKTCHVDEGERSENRLRDAEFQRTHGPRWKTNHGLGDLTLCQLCHEPSKCERCHGVPLPHSTGFGASHGREAIDKGKPVCTACHTPGFCNSCHGMEMPHGSGYLRAHSGIAKGYEDPRCMVCHTTENCGQCHVRHAHPGNLHRFRNPTRMYEQ